jgi:hypothetical protein
MMVCSGIVGTGLPVFSGVLCDDGRWFHLVMRINSRLWSSLRMPIADALNQWLGLFSAIAEHRFHCANRLS